MRRIAAITLIACYLLPAQITPEHFIHDDAYFYPQIASIVVSGGGSSFHGITPTNGYHPLWMLPCVVAVAAVGGEPAAALRLLYLIQGLLTIGLLLAFRRFLGRHGLAAADYAFGMALLAAFLLCTALYGSEAHLNACMLMLGIGLLASAMEAQRVDRILAAGAVLALAVLARLDNVFVVAALCGVFAWSEARRSSPAQSARRTLLLLLPPLLLVGGYMLANQLSFGHPTPISGAIKSTFPHPGFDLDNLSPLGKLMALLALFGCLATAFLPGGRRLRHLLLGLGLGVLGRAAYVVMFTDHYTFWSWYYVPGVLHAALLSALLIGGLRSRLGMPFAWLFRAATAGMVLAGLGYGWAKAINPTQVGGHELPLRFAECRWPEQVGDWMREHLPPGSGVLAYDWPGALAVRSRLRILAADGLVNDFDYNRDLVELGAAEYLCRSGIHFYFGRKVESPGAVGPQRELEVTRIGEGWQEIELRAPLTQLPAGRIIVRDENLIVSIQEVVDCPQSTPAAAIWRLDLDCEHSPGSADGADQSSSGP